MNRKSSRSDKVGGLLAVALGILAILEAVRLYGLRSNEFTFDHLVPAVLGGLLILLGLVLFVLRSPAFPVQWPQGHERRTFWLTVVLVFSYCILLPLLGYTLSTLLVSFALFRVIGTYKWLISLLYAVLTTACMYVVFIWGLNMSFPTGYFDL